VGQRPGGGGSVNANALTENTDEIGSKYRIPKALTNRFDVWKKKVNMNVKSKIVKEELNRELHSFS